MGTASTDQQIVDSAAVDHVLATTRAVRRRLDLDRPVENSVLYDCIDLAEQAPTGGNLGSRRWMVIRDPEVKAAVAEQYRAVSDLVFANIGDGASPVMISAKHLADHLHEVPALVIVCIHGTHDASGNPGLFDSVVQAAWSFCLALRARGLGSAWTTMHLSRREEVAEILGIPDGVTQIVLLPVAYTTGGDFSPAPRRPAAEITYIDRWGYTTTQPPGDSIALADEPGVTVEIDIAATPRRIWSLVSDPNTPASFDNELMRAEWLDEPGPGARFVGHNRIPDVADWETTNHISIYEPPLKFGWHVIDPDEPSARWTYEIEPLGGMCRLRYRMVMGPGLSGTTHAMQKSPEKAARILGGRRRTLVTNMTNTLEGIRNLAEADPRDNGST